MYVWAFLGFLFGIFGLVTGAILLSRGNPKGFYGIFGGVSILLAAYKFRRYDPH
jgi:uncharacterized membrane protein YfcA